MTGEWVTEVDPALTPDPGPLHTLHVTAPDQGPDPDPEAEPS